MNTSDYTLQALILYTETKAIKENFQITNSLKEGKTVTVTFQLMHTCPITFTTSLHT